MSTPEEAEVIKARIGRDYDDADHAAMKYIISFGVEMQARGLMIQDATRKFADFLKLPESSSRLGAIWDFAFAALSILPGFGIAKALEESAAAVEIAAKLGDRRAQALKLVVAGAEAAEKVNVAKETAASLQEKGEKLAATAPGLAELKKLDVNKGPIKQLLKSAYTAVALWGKVLDILAQEKEIRLVSHETPAPESMTALASRLLPRIQPLGDDDLAQIESQYLWAMISAYAKDNVEIVRWTYPGQGKTDVSIDGFNDNQQETLIDMFSFDNAKRGKYFYQAPPWNIYGLLVTWGVSTRHEVVMMDNVGSKI